MYGNKLLSLAKTTATKHTGDLLAMSLCSPSAEQPLQAPSLRRHHLCGAALWLLFCFPHTQLLCNHHLLSSAAAGKISTATKVWFNCVLFWFFRHVNNEDKIRFLATCLWVTNFSSPYASETVSSVYYSPAKPYVFFINLVNGQAAYATEGIFSSRFVQCRKSQCG